MQPASIPAPVQAFAPDFARRFSAIMAALAALVARRFLRDPRLALFIVPLWNRLHRYSRRFERLMAHLAAGTLPKPRAPGRSGGSHRSAIALPTGRAWLIRDLGSEAAGYASQLQALLAERAAAAILALVPAAQRILNPVKRLLGIGAFALRPRPVRPTPPAPEPLGEVAFRSQGYTWYVVPTPPAKLA